MQVLPADLGATKDVALVLDITAGADFGLCIDAAYGTPGLSLASRLEDEVDLLWVNCKSVLRLSHAFGNRFAARGRGGLVLMSSTVGFQGPPWAATYTAMKAYV